MDDYTRLILLDMDHAADIPPVVILTTSGELWG